MTGRRSQSFVRVFGAIAAALVAAGSAGAETPAKLTPLDPPRKISIGVVGQTSDAGLYVAIEKGYFKEMGLAVDPVVFQSATNMIGPLGTGELDVGGGATTAGLWNAELRNIGIRAVADKGSTRKGWSFLALVTKPDSAIKTCADFKGKRLGNSSTSNSVSHSIDMWLNKCGLSLRDVDFKAMPYPQVPPAIVNGALDVGHLGEPLITLNERKGLLRVLARQDEMRPVEQTAAILFSEKFRKDMAAANRFMVAYVRGIQDYLDAYAKGKPPADWFIDVMTKHTPVKDRTLYSSVVPAGLDEWGRLNLEAMRSDFEWFKKEKLIVSDAARFEDGVDTSFVDFAKAYIEAYYSKK